MQTNVKKWERLISASLGFGLLAVVARRKARHPVLAWSALGLVARGISGLCPVNAALGRDRSADDTAVALAGSRGIRVKERLVIAKPAAQLYAFWRDLRNLPHVISHLEHVDVLDERRSHWVLRGPAGLRVAWDAEIINEVPSRLIGWRSLPGSDVASAGSVQFRPISDDATEMRVSFQYEPPAGKIGASLAWLAGQGPSALLREDLRRFKQILEQGPVPEADQPSGRLSWLVVQP